MTNPKYVWAEAQLKLMAQDEMAARQERRNDRLFSAALFALGGVWLVAMCLLLALLAAGCCPAKTTRAPFHGGRCP